MLLLVLKCSLVSLNRALLPMLRIVVKNLLDVGGILCWSRERVMKKS